MGFGASSSQQPFPGTPGALIPAGAPAPPPPLPWRNRAAFHVQQFLLLLPPAVQGQGRYCHLLILLGSCPEHRFPPPQGCSCFSRAGWGCENAEDPSVDEVSERAPHGRSPGVTPALPAATRGQFPGPAPAQLRQQRPAPPQVRSRLDRGRSSSPKAAAAAPAGWERLGRFSRSRSPARLRGGAARPAGPRAGSR